MKNKNSVSPSAPSCPHSDNWNTCDVCRPTLKSSTPSSWEEEFKQKFGEFRVPDTYYYGFGKIKDGFTEKEIKQFFRSKISEAEKRGHEKGFNACADGQIKII